MADVREEMMKARSLLERKRYAEAREILERIDHLKAREWLTKLDHAEVLSHPEQRHFLQTA